MSASLVARVTMIGLDSVPPPHCDKHDFMDCGPRKVGIFRVDDFLKGSSQPVIRIELDTLSCGAPHPRMGEATWIAAYGDAEVGYSFPPCSGFDGPPAEGGRSPLGQTIAQYRGRLESLDDAARQHPSDLAALMELAEFLAETNDRLAATSILDKVLAIDRLHRRANILKAKQLARGPDQQAVLDSLQPYLAAHPDDRDAMHQRVLALVRLDRLSEVPGDWQDFTGIYGSQYDFSNRKLNGASFRGNYMNLSSFAGSELRHVQFSDAGIRSGNFAGADLTGAAMADADLMQAKFPGAVLDGANLSGAAMQSSDLRGASLKGANLSGTRLTDAHYDDATIWPDGFDPIAAGAKKQ